MVDAPRIPPTFSTPVHTSNQSGATRDVVINVKGAPPGTAIGSLLEGKVISQTASGYTTLQTPHGTVTFQSQVGLLKGSLVTLRILTTETDFQARLVTINGESLIEYLGHNPSQAASGRVKTPFTLPQDEVVQQGAQQSKSFASQLGVQAEQAASQTTLSPIQRHSIIHTTLLDANKAGIADLISKLPPALQNQLITAAQQAIGQAPTGEVSEPVLNALVRSGNVLEFRVVEYTPPQLAQTQTAATQTVPSDGEEAVLQTGQTPQSQAARGAPAQIAAQVSQTQQVSAAAQGVGNTPTATANAASSNQAPLPPIPTELIVDAKTGQVRIPAVVIGAEDSLAVVKTPVGTLMIPAALPRGTKLELELTGLSHIALPEAAQQAAGSVSGQATDAMGKLMNFWKLFGDSTLSQHMASQGNAQVLQNQMPAPDRELGAKLLNYFKAVQQEDPSLLLGKSVTDALKRNGHHAMLDQLQRDLSGFKQLWTQPQQDWRTLLFPVVADDTWYQNRLMVKDYEHKSEQEIVERGTRFVLDVDLESLGPLQLDGLYRVSGPSKSFDLSLKSKQPLPDAMKEGIISIFQEAQDEMGVNGTLVFQVMKSFPAVLQEGGSGGIDEDSILV